MAARFSLSSPVALALLTLAVVCLFSVALAQNVPPVPPIQLTPIVVDPNQGADASTKVPSFLLPSLPPLSYFSPGIFDSRSRENQENVSSDATLLASSAFGMLLVALLSVLGL